MSEELGTGAYPSSHQYADAAPSRGGFLIFSVAWCILCVALPYAFTDFKAIVFWSLPSLLQYAIVTYSGTHLALLLHSGRPRWFDSMFWAFSYIWLGIAGYAQLAAGDNPYNLHFTLQSYETASLITLVGMFCYDIGRMLGNRRAWGARRHSARVVDRRRTELLAVAALIITPIVVNTLGGWSALFTTRSQRVSDLASSGFLAPGDQASGASLLTIMYCLPLVSLLGLIRTLQQDRERRRQAPLVVLTFLLGILTILVANPISNPRYWSGTVLLGILFSLHWSSSRIGYRVVLVSALSALLIIFPYADYFRYALHPTSLEPMSELLVSKGDYDASVQMVAAVDFVNGTGGTHGRQILGVFGFFVPRSMWPEKPGATGTLLAQYTGSNQVNVSSPLWIEAFVDGGYLALIVAFSILGIIASWAQSRVRVAGTNGATWSLLLLPLLAAYSIIILRGSLLSSIGGLVVLVFLTWFITKPQTSSGRPVLPSSPQPPP